MATVPSPTRLDWFEVIDRRESRFKSAKDLTQLLRSVGIECTRPIVISCDSVEEGAPLAFAWS